jgi:hypothetical protein
MWQCLYPQDCPDWDLWTANKLQLQLQSVFLTDTFTSITTISTSLVLPVYGYTENKGMNEWKNEM